MCLFCRYREKALEEIGITDPSVVFGGGTDIHGNTVEPASGGSEVAYPGGPDDYAANTSTTGSVTVGGTATGEMEIETDEDWFAISLTAGQSIQINLDGITLYDPIVGIYNSSGTLLDINDDASSSTLNSQLIFTATSAGTYYIAAAAFPWSTFDNIGTYQITVTSAGGGGGGGSGPGGLAGSIPSPTTDPLLMDIDWGTQIDTNTCNVYFAPSGYSADGYTSEGFNAYEMGQFQLAFDTIESFSGLNFNVVTSAANADFVVLLDTNEVLGGFLGYFNPPGTLNEGVGVFDGTSWDRTAGGDLEQGGFGYVTIVHELLHGLGLAHPHDTGGTSTVMDGVTSAFDDFGTYDLNQGVFTTMTYNSGWHTGPTGTGPFFSGSYGFEGGPMAIDIAALQENYGTNTNYNNGNNTYVLPTGSATGTFFTCIWDTGGTDTISHSGSLAATIDLRAATITEAVGGGGYVSFAAGTPGGFTIANGVVIENATGGTGNDTITGNDANNTLNGGAGRDEIAGNGGNDTINGGGGHDSITGGGGLDRLLGGDGFDTIEGGLGNDLILGNAGNDRLYGGASQDEIRGGTQNDNLYGETGDDTLLGEAGFDRLDGGDDNDVLDGGGQADNLLGRGGNDILLGGTGFDRLFGGVGDDSLDGGDGSDGLYGNGNRDTINGGAGDDRIYGGGGFDILNGGADNDELSGNLNADTFVFENGHGNDTIRDFEEFNNSEVIDFSGLSSMNTIGQVLAASTQVGANVVINTGGGNSITLLNVNLGDLDANDFVF